jgi:hypothetical protein
MVHSSRADRWFDQHAARNRRLCFVGCLDRAGDRPILMDVAAGRALADTGRLARANATTRRFARRTRPTEAASPALRLSLVTGLGTPASSWPSTSGVSSPARLLPCPQLKGGRLALLSARGRRPRASGAEDDVSVPATNHEFSVVQFQRANVVHFSQAPKALLRPVSVTARRSTSSDISVRTLRGNGSTISRGIASPIPAGRLLSVDGIGPRWAVSRRDGRASGSPPAEPVAYPSSHVRSHGIARVSEIQSPRVFACRGTIDRQPKPSGSVPACRTPHPSPASATRRISRAGGTLLIWNSRIARLEVVGDGARLRGLAIAVA